jgi:hypothetical protein
MYNEEIYQKLAQQFDESDMGLVCDIISTLYDIKYEAAKNTDALNEFDYERDWWKNKENELTYKTKNVC